MATIEDVIRIISPHCKVGVTTIRILRREGLEPAIKYLRSAGVPQSNIDLLKKYVNTK